LEFCHTGGVLGGCVWEFFYDSGAEQVETADLEGVLALGQLRWQLRERARRWVIRPVDWGAVVPLDFMMPEWGAVPAIY
jgi:hypothetical protein